MIYNKVKIYLAMATEQQNHLKSVVEQSQTLVNEINQLEGRAKQKRNASETSRYN